MRVLRLGLLSLLRVLCVLRLLRQLPTPSAALPPAPHIRP
jgi:hypothetical protein